MHITLQYPVVSQVHTHPQSMYPVVSTQPGVLNTNPWEVSTHLGVGVGVVE